MTDGCAIGPKSPPVILAADDSEDDRFMFAQAVSKAQLNATLHVLPSGDRAVAMLNLLLSREELPLLCFLDVKMPGMDGFDVLRWIRLRSELKRMPVIMLSSSDDPSDIRRAVAGGAQCYLRKNATISDLRTVLEYAEQVASGLPRSPLARIECQRNLMCMM
ncbi:MAG TPA: response regulator [Opitutaceae bacterium]|jgi:CheY-like chemotaxis protein